MTKDSKETPTLDTSALEAKVDSVLKQLQDTAAAKPKVEPKAEPAKQEPTAQDTAPKQSLGTPATNAPATLTLDDLNSKSVEWMADNIDKVNNLVAA